MRWKKRHIMATLSLGFIDMNNNIRMVEFNLVKETSKTHLDTNGIQLMERTLVEEK